MAAANASLGDLRTWTHHVYSRLVWFVKLIRNSVISRSQQVHAPHIQAWHAPPTFTSTVPWLGRLVVGFSPRRSRFLVTGQSAWDLLWRERQWDRVFLRVLWFSPVRIIPPLSHTLSCFIRRHYRISLTDGVVKWTRLTTHLHFLLAGSDLMIFPYLIVCFMPPFLGT